MTDSTANTANTVDTTPAHWFKPGNPGGPGQKSWVLTDERKKQIVEAASKGKNLTAIAIIIGLRPNTLTLKRKEDPEIDELIAEGKAKLSAMLMDISFRAINDPRDKSRNQELARLHRIAKTEEIEYGATTEEFAPSGFTIEIIPNKKPVDPSTES